MQGTREKLKKVDVLDSERVLLRRGVPLNFQRCWDVGVVVLTPDSSSVPTDPAPAPAPAPAPIPVPEYSSAAPAPRALDNACIECVDADEAAPSTPRVENPAQLTAENTKLHGWKQKQYQAKQNKTKQNKTKQNKTKTNINTKGSDKGDHIYLRRDWLRLLRPRTSWTESNRNIWCVKKVRVNK